MNAPKVSGPRTMDSALQPTADPAWVIEQHGFDPLRDGSRQSRFAVSNGFLGIRGARAVNRVPTGRVLPCTYVAGLFDVRGSEQPIPALIPVADWLRVDVAAPGGFHQWFQNHLGDCLRHAIGNGRNAEWARP